MMADAEPAAPSESGPTYREATVETIVARLQKLKADGQSAAVFLGAGASRSAGIPLAAEIVSEIEQEYGSLVADCPVRSYPAYLGRLEPLERSELLGKYVREARVNPAHLYLATLVREGYVDRILTTNFDPLALHSLVLANARPFVYDITGLNPPGDGFGPIGPLVAPAIVHLHGQLGNSVNLGPDSGGSSPELEQLRSRVRGLLKETLAVRPLIVVGYSGENDPVFTELCDCGPFTHPIFWVYHRDAEPKAHVYRSLLKDLTSHSYYVRNQDADRFFMRLVGGLGLSGPLVTKRPFSFLEEALAGVAGIDSGQDGDLAQESRQWAASAARHFEGQDRTGATRPASPVEDPALRTRLELETIDKRAREALAEDRFDELEELLEPARALGAERALDFLAQAFSNRGARRLALTRADAGGERKKALELAGADFRQATELRPELDEALYEWGLALAETARLLPPEESRGVLAQAGEKLSRAAALQPGSDRAFYHWGLVLVERARVASLGTATPIESQDAAREFLAEACARLGRASELSPYVDEVFYHWGSALVSLARLQPREDAKRSLTQACERFRRAAEVSPDRFRTFFGWGVALIDLAGVQPEKAQDALTQAGDKFRQAAAIKPDQVEVFYRWAIALHQLARFESKTTEPLAQLPGRSQSTLDAAVHRFERAAALIERDRERLNASGAQITEAEVLLGWGLALRDLARHKPRAEPGAETLRAAVLVQAADKLGRAAAIEPENADLPYNLGLVFEELAGSSPGDEAPLIQAAEQFRRVVEVDPNHEDAHYRLGRIHLSLAAYQSLKGVPDGESASRFLRQAVESFGRAAEIGPGRYELLDEWGAALIQLARQTGDGADGDASVVELLSQAAEILRRAAVMNPVAGAFNRYGQVLVELSRHESDALAQATLEKAAAQFASSTELRPEEPESFYSWGLALEELGRRRPGDEAVLSQAADKFRIAAERRPDHDALYHWGRTLALLARTRATSRAAEECLGLLFQAADKLRRSAEVRPEPDTFHEWGLVLEELGRHQPGDEVIQSQAAEKFRRAVEIRPDHDAALCGWASALVNLSRLKPVDEARPLLLDAVERLRTAAQIKPGRDDILVRWGEALVELGRREPEAEARATLAAACDRFRNAAELNPGRFETLDRWCDACFELIRLQPADEAIRTIEEVAARLEPATELQPDVVDGFLRQAQLLEALARLQPREAARATLTRAAEKVERAQVIDPGCPDAMSLGGRILAALGRLEPEDTARTSFGRACEKLQQAAELLTVQTPQVSAVEGWRSPQGTYRPHVTARSSPLADVFYSWAAALVDLARIQYGDEARLAFGEAFDKFRQASELTTVDISIPLSPDSTVASALEVQESAPPARRDAESALILREWAIALVDLARIQSEEEARAALKEAGDKFQQAIEKDPEDGETLCRWGNALVDLARLETGSAALSTFALACERFQRASELVPERHGLFYDWGAALVDLARIQPQDDARKSLAQAYEKFRRAAEIQPDEASAFCRWGIALASLARLQTKEEARATLREACDRFGRAVELSPADYGGHHNWGNALAELARLGPQGPARSLLTQAESRLAEAARLKPHNHVVQNDWGNVLVDLGRSLSSNGALEDARAALGSACERFHQAARLKPHFHKVFSDWAVALTELARLRSGDEARAALSEACDRCCRSVEIRPDQPDVSYRWALALVDLARLQAGEAAKLTLVEAADKFRRSAEARSGDPEFFYNWGTALEDLARLQAPEPAKASFREACERFRRADELKPNDHETYNNWGIALAGLAQLLYGDEAKASLKEACDKFLRATETRRDAQRKDALRPTPPESGLPTQ